MTLRGAAFFALMVAMSPIPAHAQTVGPHFDPVFADHAVLQRDRPLRLSGSAAPGQALKLKVAEQSVAVVADASGNWAATLSPLAAGGPYRMTVTGSTGNSAAIDDIMIGDVFLCGGQSNMSYLTKFATNASNQLKTPADPMIRFATIPIDQPSLERMKLRETIGWRIAAPDTLGETSAVCYYMALELKKAKGVTIGLVRSSLGGTRVERWLSADALRQVPPFGDRVAALQAFAKSPEAGRAASHLPLAPRAPWTGGNGLGTLYNGMIAPLRSYAFKGVIWYQGESNVPDPFTYRRLLPMLMRDWRRTFADPALPFVMVQLTAFGPVATKPVKSDWAETREVQRQVALTEPKTALVVSIDSGDRSDIHPAQKKIVGQRIARAMRNLAYGDPVSVGGPRPTAAVRKGSDVVIRFDDTDGALLTYSADQAIGFEICDRARACRYAAARVEGDSVVLNGSNQPAAAFVRYAWANSPVVNLYGKTDIPAIPFELAIP